MKCHICDNPKVEELETVLHSDGVMKAYYCKAGCGCRVAAEQSAHPTVATVAAQEVKSDARPKAGNLSH